MKKEALFNVFYAAKEETLKAIKKPWAIRKLKRKFASAYDSAIQKIEEAQEKLNACYEKLHEMDINDLIKASREVEDAKAVQQVLKEEYQKLFGKEFIVDEEDLDEEAAN